MNEQVTINATHSIRVYAEDVDHMGILYHANHLKYLERARSELLRNHGHSLKTLADEGTHFAIKSIHIDYCAPAKLDDCLRIETEYCVARKTTLNFLQRMYNSLDSLICQAKVEMVCLNEQLKPKRLPAVLSL